MTATISLPVDPQLRELWAAKMAAEAARPMARRRHHLPAVVLIYAGLFLTGFGAAGTYRTMPDRPDISQLRTHLPAQLSRFIER